MFSPLDRLSMRVSSHHTVYKDSSEFNTSLQSTKKPLIRYGQGLSFINNHHSSASGSQWRS
nr:MAG TPA: hypothetical protein [Caudoviricetes sp.]